MTQFLRDVAAPLRTLDPADPDVSDLAGLHEIVGDARVVAIGESAHGVSEFYRLKDRLLRFLVRELGFTAFVMESGFPEGLAVNDWVLGGAGELDHVSRTGITYRFGECDEMRAQLKWMREWNATHDRKVRFYGMDVPGSQANPGSGIAACLARLEPVPDDAALLILADLGDQFEARVRYPRMTPADRERLSKGVAGIIARAMASGDGVTERCALSLKCLDHLLMNGVASPGRPRDELMAENVRWILEHEPRILISAHNGHIQRTHPHGPVLGQLLARTLGNDMVVVGTTFASGLLARFHVLDQDLTRFAVSLEEIKPPPHSLDALLDGLGLPLHLVDLHRVTAEQISSATQIMLSHDPFEIVPKTAFDALIHVRSVANYAGLFETYRESIARAETIARGNVPA